MKRFVLIAAAITITIALSMIVAFVPATPTASADNQALAFFTTPATNEVYATFAATLSIEPAGIVDVGSELLTESPRTIAGVYCAGSYGMTFVEASSAEMLAVGYVKIDKTMTNEDAVTLTSTPVADIGLEGEVVLANTAKTSAMSRMTIALAGVMENAAASVRDTEKAGAAGIYAVPVVVVG
jgi:hypothetical protein